MEPITRKEKYLSVKATGSGTVPEPVTREEHFLAGMATGETDNLPEPITREEKFLDAAARGGGSSVTVEPLSVTENGAYTADEGKAYSPVTVNVQEVDPERIDGTVAVPFSMDVAAEIHSKCNNIAPTAAATINVPVTGMGVLPCVVLAGGGDGTNTMRALICGAAMPTSSTNYGMVTLTYSLDTESIDPETSQSIITPLDNVALVDKKVFGITTGGSSTSVNDLSTLVPTTATTVTFISRYEHGQATQPDE